LARGAAEAEGRLKPSRGVSQGWAQPGRGGPEAVGSAESVPAARRHWLIASVAAVEALVGLPPTQRLTLCHGFGERIDKALSGISYSLYLTHAPVPLLVSFIFCRACILFASGCRERAGVEPELPSRPDKRKSRAPKGPASQTGRLHVWET